MPKPTVCLALMMKNEAHILKRMIDSALPFVDSYFVIDTGSADDSIQVAKECLVGLPGEIVEEPWTNFGVNRTSLVQRASEGGADYLLLADADMVFDTTDPDDHLDHLTADSYLIRMAGGFEFWMPYLVKASLPWSYYGVTHEFLGVEGVEWTQERHPTFIIHHLADGGTRPEKFTRDRELLEEEYAKNPDDVRTVFYLAQTCKDMGDTERSRELYQRRADLGGWDEEVYWSLFQIGEITQDPMDYLRAWNFRPSRPEASHRLMKRYNELGLYRASYLHGLLKTDKFLAPGPTEDILFIERWSEDWGITFEFAIAAWWVGRQEDSIELFRELLERDDIPEAYRESCKNNLANCGAPVE
jgi:glycosyltransferase involved in cell wall biosynthesis